MAQVDCRVEAKRYWLWTMRQEISHRQYSCDGREIFFARFDERQPVVAFSRLYSRKIEGLLPYLATLSSGVHSFPTGFSQAACRPIVAHRFLY